MTSKQKGLTLEHWRKVMEKYRKAEGISDLMVYDGIMSSHTFTRFKKKAHFGRQSGESD